VTLEAVEGAAGCGKTYRLMEMLGQSVTVAPPIDGQRVLALTFMHGARRRLSDKLRSVAGIGGRVACSTIDAFAWRLVRRWRGLAVALELPSVAESDFDAVCDGAGALLEHPQVAAWVAQSFPFVIVDEGQDLHPQRLRMLRALATTTRVLVAADEFQCLDQNLRPNPLIAWLNTTTNPRETLTQVHRTNVAGLLNAASAIRSGQPPSPSGQVFQVMVGQSVPLAATMLSNAIGWHLGTADVAVITPSRTPFVQQVVERTSTTGTSQGNGPYPILWEGSDQSEANLITEDLSLDSTVSLATAIAALHQLPPSGPVRQAIAWVERQRDAAGRSDVTRAELEATILRYVTLRRQYGGEGKHRYKAMTVHQAKNREFDGVVVLWPFQVPTDAEQRRRLLYNAVTRARRWCTIILQGQSIATTAPFA
jgi:superfamily I DNA/RNA helicase